MDKYKGQFFTPNEVSKEMHRRVSKYLPKKKLIIIDPCVGKGSLIKPFLTSNRKSEFYCFEIDKKFCKEIEVNLKKQDIKLKIFNKDYLLDNHLEGKVDFSIINPPYVRQEWIDTKSKVKYIENFKSFFQEEINKKSNLMVYFLLKTITDLKIGGIACVIVYDILENSKYGKDFFNIFYKYCEVLEKYPLKTPFDDVLIDAKVYIFKKKEREVYNPSSIKKNNSNETSSLGELFPSLCRGIGLRSKKVFVMNTEDDLKFKKFTKKIILNAKSIEKKTRKISPHNAFLFVDEKQIPLALKKYLSEKSLKTTKKDIKSFTHKQKKSQIIFNYFFREKPYFSGNPLKINVSDNFYLMDSSDLSLEAIIVLLNSKYFINPIKKNSRNMGSGLSKIQLYEFKETIVPNWKKLDKKTLKKFEKELLANKENEKFLNKVIKKYI